MRGCVTVRMFIGIPILGEALEEIKRIVEMVQSPKGKITPLGNLHMTLAFLGEMPNQRLGAVRSAMQKVSSCYGQFSVPLARLGTFQKSGILFLETGDPEGKLNLLAKLVRSELGKVGVEVDGKKFVPHITLKRRDNEEEIREYCREISVNKKLLWISEIYLYQSQLTKAGPRYRVYNAYPLHGGK